MRILVGYDGRENGDDALRFARELAAIEGAQLHVVAALDYAPLPIAVDAYERALEEHFDEIFERAAQVLGETPFERRPVSDGSPARALNDRAEHEEADLIVVGSTHRGRLGRVYPGSVADRLLNGAPCPVVVVPRGYAPERPGLGLVGVGYDGSPESRTALASARHFAKALDAELELIGVVPPIPSVPPVWAGTAADVEVAMRERLEEALARAAEEIDCEFEVSTALLEGDPAAALAARGVELDLLVLGSRGYGPIRRALLGSVSAAVARTAPCPVLVIPRGWGEG
ncbi:MAG TPA: universal stress protein [Solirubrobacterales bacterium]|jgi:nucleotide-binding universal stress UspA family protein